MTFITSLQLQSKPVEDCGNNEKAQQLYTLIVNDKDQNRTRIRCNPLLTRLAMEKAKKMQEFGLVQHNLGGSPNAHLSNGGYQLPDYYGVQFHANQVEAVAGGYETAAQVWEAFKNSSAHRSHLLGEHEFYLEQDEIGVGFIREWHSPHVEYWVVYLTKGYSPNQSIFDGRDDLPNKSNLVIQK
ncbi:CAP domain-containing protein [Psychrosphaera sp. 1_MG-2023]|uniref:CAP domain-containing protein n=1 Tax=Psychrosphaera algicola TaxID=3023714 RepID=A0ABT5FHI4_9GAMM|nr:MULTISPECIES: CAP domain-containing protein [unclassified Psychrosphaera]MDC2890641.1 CAP domain-containing protein [Psychrosphaera sp. G1-22]MDO6720289.1 CAP domain-containing protein [Psychrosphaera sp. 1_MG-2023]